MGCPRGTVEEIRTWRAVHVDLRKSRTEDSADIEEARLRKTNAEAALLELKFQQESGELVSTDGVVRMLSQLFALISRRHELYRSRVVALVPAELRADVGEVLEQEGIALQNDLSNLDVTEQE